MTSCCVLDSCCCVDGSMSPCTQKNISLRSTQHLFPSLSLSQGSGGTNGALDHYNETGRQFPLVVKLGTITSDITTADCYSYAPDEDGPVQIPNLLELLQKRGIQVAAMYVVVC